MGSPFSYLEQLAESPPKPQDLAAGGRFDFLSDIAPAAEPQQPSSFAYLNPTAEAVAPSYVPPGNELFAKLKDSPFAKMLPKGVLPTAEVIYSTMGRPIFQYATDMFSASVHATARPGSSLPLSMVAGANYAATQADREMLGETGDMEAIVKREDSLMGLAMVASTIPSFAAPAAAAAIVPAAARFGLAARSAVVASTEALGGATFGGIRGLQEGESRGEAIMKDAAIFGVLGGGLNLTIGKVSTLLNRRIGELSPAQRREIGQIYAEKLQEMSKKVSDDGGNVANLHPAEKQAHQNVAAYQALEELDPKHVDLDERALETLRKDLEVEPRLQENIEYGDLEVLEGSAQRNIDLPDEWKIDKTPEFVAPPVGAEPAPVPKGMIHGAGTPASIQQEAEGLSMVFFRGASEGRSPLEPGYLGTTFMSDSPNWAAMFLTNLGDVTDPGTIHRLRIDLKNPFIIGHWDKDLKWMLPVDVHDPKIVKLRDTRVEITRKRDAAFYRTQKGLISSEDHAIFLNRTVEELAEIDIQIAARQKAIDDIVAGAEKKSLSRDRRIVQEYWIKELKKQGYDGLVVLDAPRDGNVAEIIAFNQKSAVVEQSLKLDDTALQAYAHELGFGNINDPLARAEALTEAIGDFEFHVFPAYGRGLRGEEALTAGLKAGDYPVAGGRRDIWRQFQEFVGDDVVGINRLTRGSLTGKTAEYKQAVSTAAVELPDVVLKVYGTTTGIATNLKSGELYMLGSAYRKHRGGPLKLPVDEAVEAAVRERMTDLHGIAERYAIDENGMIPKLADHLTGRNAIMQELKKKGSSVRGAKYGIYPSMGKVEYDDAVYNMQRIASGSGQVDPASLSVEQLQHTLYVLNDEIAIIELAVNHIRGAQKTLTQLEEQMGPVQDAFAKALRSILDDMPITPTKSLDELKSSLAAGKRQTASQELDAAFAEPRMVDLQGPTAAPAGIEATSRAERSRGTEATSEIKQNLMVQDAIDEAMERVDPIQTSTPNVKSAAIELERQVQDPYVIRQHVPKERVLASLDAALKRPEPLATEGLVFDLTGPTPRDIAFDSKIPKAEQRKTRSVLNETLRREQAPIEIPPEEIVNASWIDDIADPTDLTAPKIDGWGAIAHMTEDLFNTTSKRLTEDGAVQAAVIARLGLAATGGVLYAAGTGFEDPVGKNTLRTVGGFLMVASVGGPIFRRVMAQSKFARRVTIMYNPEVVLSGRGKDAFRDYREVLAFGRTAGINHKKIVLEAFPDKETWKNVALALDEGPNSPAWHLLTTEQQREAKSLWNLNTWLGQMGEQEGLFEHAVENYYRRILPPETFGKWVEHGYYKTLTAKGGFTKGRRINKLRDLIDWADKQGLPGPRLDLPNVQAIHMEEMYRAVARARIQRTLKKVGLLRKVLPDEELPSNWRRIKVPDMTTYYAHEEVALSLENIAGSHKASELILAADKIKSWWMRSIMFWFWEHGLNALRAVPAIAFDPRGYGRAWKQISNADPAMLEAARYGVRFFDRPDYGPTTARAFDEMMGTVQKSLKITGLVKKGAHLIHMQDKILWEHIVPSLGLHAYNTQMLKWSMRTKGAFNQGSKEYAVAARKAADFANTMMGKVPTEMQDPGLARALRLVLFSPQWSFTRIKISAQAAGELGQLMTGQMSRQDLVYLPFKLRQLAAGVAITYVGSKLLSGEAPQFNERTHKYYMKTPWAVEGGKKVGLDLLGWWQDDLKFYNAPMSFFTGRLNPSMRSIGEFAEGRDFTGKSLTTPEAIANIARSFGPPAELAEAVIRVARDGMPPAGERLQRMSGITATANVSTLPRPMDAALTKYARRILLQTGVAPNDETVWEMTRLMRSNMLNGQSIIDQQVINFIAYRRRASARREPLAHLWYDARRIVADLAKEGLGQR